LKSAHTTFLGRAAAVMAAACLVGGLAAGPVRADSATTKKQLQAALNKLHGLERRIASGSATVAHMRADMTALVTEIDHVQSQIARTQYLIVKKEAEIQDAQGQLDGTREQLNQRAWVAYENGPGSSLDFLLGATSLSDLADRLVIVNSAASNDQDLIIQIQEEQNRLRSRQAELESLENSLRDKRNHLNQQQAVLQSKLDAEQAVLNQLEADKAQANQLVAELRKRYNAQLAAEEAARLRRLGYGGSSGNFKPYAGVFLTCPVPGAVFSDDFGAPRFGGGYHLHAGNDLFAARGTPIHAPFAGTAERSDNGLGGIAVKVYGSLGWVYNAHMDHVEGAFPRSVSTGDVIGYVGDSGDARGGATHDHFEWHPNDASRWPTWTSPYGVSRVGTAIDPYPFNRATCG
jgi:peptidoglycan hydrolase CwlO-like protein